MDSQAQTKVDARTMVKIARGIIKVGHAGGEVMTLETRIGLG